MFERGPHNISLVVSPQLFMNGEQKTRQLVNSQCLCSLCAGAVDAAQLLYITMLMTLFNDQYLFNSQLLSTIQLWSPNNHVHQLLGFMQISLARLFKRFIFLT